MFKKISELLTPHDKKFLILLIFFSLFISVMETFAVSIVMPFISVASDFSLIESNQYFKRVYDFLGIHSAVNFVVVFGCLLALFYIVRSVINTFYFYMLAKFSEGRYYHISQKLFDTYMHLGNRQFNNLHTGHLTKMIINEASYFTQIISSLLFMISEVFVILFIYVILLYVDWKSTLTMSIVIAIIVGLLLKKITGVIKTKGQEREQFQKDVYGILASTFGNFRVIKLFSGEKAIVEKFAYVTDKYVQTNILFQTLSHIPRLVLDTLGFASLGLVIAYIVWTKGTDISSFMPILSLYVLALYRLLPSIHRIITHYNKIMFYSKSIDLVSDEMAFDQERLGGFPLSFEKNIIFEYVNFWYTQGERVLENINLTIDKNESIGIVGESGSGKSTLVDMIIGLSLPSAGKIIIDGQVLNGTNLKAWRKQIGYIPQSVYLFDGTVSDNIVFGRKYDHEKVMMLLKKVRLWESLLEKDRENTLVGEGGKLLSGGQRQRIAIARALYSNPDILVLDEATSALDPLTESEIMSEIYDIAKEKTLIIISHKKEVLLQCDTIYEVRDRTLFLAGKGR